MASLCEGFGSQLALWRKMLSFFCYEAAKKGSYRKHHVGIMPSVFVQYGSGYTVNETFKKWMVRRRFGCCVLELTTVVFQVNDRHERSLCKGAHCSWCAKSSFLPVQRSKFILPGRIMLFTLITSQSA